MTSPQLPNLMLANGASTNGQRAESVRNIETSTAASNGTPLLDPVRTPATPAPTPARPALPVPFLPRKPGSGGNGAESSGYSRNGNSGNGHRPDVHRPEAHRPAAPELALPIRPAQYAHIVGWGMAVPETRMTNADLATFIETSDEWIVARTGIRERRIASEKETTTTLALRAAQNALDQADVLPEDLDLIIVATSTAENSFPGTANLVQAALNATKAGAFDLSAACAGFVYGVNMAAQSIRSGSIRNALVIGSETMSRIVDWQDRSTCILFGDGAGAVVLRGSPVEGGVLSGVLRSDGSGADLLHAPAVGSLDSVEMPTSENGRKLMKLSMNGGEVFKFATRVIHESLMQALQQAGLKLSDLKLIVPHQANARILQSAARSLKVDENLFFTNLDRYGNTSAASIPIALCEALQQGRISPDDHVAFIGFGGGLSWGSLIIKWGVPDEVERGRFNYQRRRVSYWLGGWRMRVARISRQALKLVSLLTRPLR